MVWYCGVMAVEGECRVFDGGSSLRRRWKAIVSIIADLIHRTFCRLAGLSERVEQFEQRDCRNRRHETSSTPRKLTFTLYGIPLIQYCILLNNTKTHRS